MNSNLFFSILLVMLERIYCSTVSSVRLVNHADYMLSIIEETMRQVEAREWCNLKVNDVNLELEEDVLGTTVMGQVTYTNGFVVSIQLIDVTTASLQQVWRFNNVANTTTVEVRGLMRLHAVTLGFDVVAKMAKGIESSTAMFTHPLLQFDFTVIKDMKKIDEIDVSVDGTVPRNTNTIRFLPETNHTQVFATLYDWNSTTIGIRSWGPEIFQPIAYKLATSDIEFPRICYNCPA